MNKRNILAAGIMAVLTLGTVSATAAFVNFERSTKKAAELPKRHAPGYLTVNPLAKQLKTAEATVAPLAEADTVKLLTDFPTAAEDITNAAKTMPESGKVTWKGFNQSDLEYNYIYSIRFEQAYDSELRTRDSWIYFPVTITADNAQLILSYGASSDIGSSKSYRGAFEWCLTSDTTPESVIATIHGVDDFMSENGMKDFTYYNDLKFNGPATAGTYYLALHMKDCKPTDPAGTLGKYDYAKFSFGKINLSQTASSSAPSVGPNGEVFTMHPTEEEFNNCTVVDGNGDGSKITYYYAESGDTVYDWPIHYNNQDATGDADEWIITPAVTLSNPDVIYTASIDAFATGSFKSEAFEICIGKTPDVASMTRVILDEPAVTNNDWKTFSSRFGVAEAGNYYFGIHIKSSRTDGWRIVMKDFVVSMTETSALVPAACQELKAVADPTGAFKATVSAKLPEQYMNLAAIPAGETVSVTIASPKASVELSGAPGEVVTAELETEDGVNLITACTSNANGKGGESKTSVACGTDIPTNPVVSSQVSDDNMTLLLTWEAPTTGVNGGVVNPDELTYKLYIYQQTDQMAGWMLLQDNIAETGIILQAPVETQTLYDFMVSACNDKGESTGGIESYCSVVLGTPYVLPVMDGFTNGQILSGINITFPTDEYYGQWALDDPGKLSDESACDDSFGLIFVPTNDGGDRGMFRTPKFTTVNASNVRVRARVYCYDNMGQADVYIEDRDGSHTLLGKIDSSLGTGWVDAMFDVPASYENKPVLNLIFDVYAPNQAAYFMLDEYEIYRRYDNDLAIDKVESPSYVALGDSLKFTATLANRGCKTVNMPEVIASVIDAETGDEITRTAIAPAVKEPTVAPDSKTAFNGSFIFNKADFAGRSYALRVEINGEDDDVENNAIENALSIGLPGGPVITDLEGKMSDNGQGIELKWSAPYSNGYVDNFESYPSGDHSTLLGQWKNIDFDRQYTYTFGEYPVADAGMPKAFQVLNLVDTQLKGGLEIPSGDQFLCAMSVAEGEADDWLISPEVKGGSKLSFYISSISEAYLEPVEVLYSTTDNDPDSFTSLATLEVDIVGWQLKEFDLPADARYFAIRYYGNDMFGIFIDDICYSPVNPEVDVTGYRVYRNDNVIEPDHKTTDYTDTDVTSEVPFVYNVAVLGKTGDKEVEYPLSNTVVVSLSGIDGVTTDRAVVSGGKGVLTITGAAGLQAEIYNTAGIKVASQAALTESNSFRLLPGIYVVKVGTAVCKVNVY